MDRKIISWDSRLSRRSKPLLIQILQKYMLQNQMTMRKSLIMRNSSRLLFLPVNIKVSKRNFNKQFRTTRRFPPSSRKYQLGQPLSLQYSWLCLLAQLWSWIPKETNCWWAPCRKLSEAQLLSQVLSGPWSWWNLRPLGWAPRETLTKEWSQLTPETSISFVSLPCWHFSKVTQSCMPPAQSQGCKWQNLTSLMIFLTM